MTPKREILIIPNSRDFGVFTRKIETPGGIYRYIIGEKYELK
jgi:hypothetical protein